MANPKYHPIPHPQLKKPQTRSAASKLDWNLPKRPKRTPRSEYGFMREYALLCGLESGRPTGGER